MDIGQRVYILQNDETRGGKTWDVYCCFGGKVAIPR